MIGRPLDPSRLVSAGRRVQGPVGAPELEEIRPLVAELREFSAVLARAVPRSAIRDDPDYHELLLHGPYSLDLPHMGLVGPRNTVSFYDGEVRVVDQAGAEISRYQPADYHLHVAEHVEPWTYLKFPYLQTARLAGFRRRSGHQHLLRGPL